MKPRGGDDFVSIFKFTIIIVQCHPLNIEILTPLTLTQFIHNIFNHNRRY